MNKKGLTFLEAIVACLAIIAIVAVIAGFLATRIDVMIKSRSFTDSAFTGRTLITVISGELKNASEIYIGERDESFEKAFYINDGLPEIIENYDSGYIPMNTDSNNYYEGMELSYYVTVLDDYRLRITLDIHNPDNNGIIEFSRTFTLTCDKLADTETPIIGVGGRDVVINYNP